MTHLETRAAEQLSALLADRAAERRDSGLTPDQAIAELEAALSAVLGGPEPTPPAPAAPAPAGTLPADGAVIVFSVVPVASYCRPGEAYRVEREGAYFRFQSVARGSATFDKAWAVARSTWQAA